jgi:hypothetical protein
MIPQNMSRNTRPFRDRGPEKIRIFEPMSEQILAFRRQVGSGPDIFTRTADFGVRTFSPTSRGNLTPYIQGSCRFADGCRLVPRDLRVSGHVQRDQVMSELKY